MSMYDTRKCCERFKCCFSKLLKELFATIFLTGFGQSSVSIILNEKDVPTWQEIEQKHIMNGA